MHNLLSMICQKLWILRRMLMEGISMEEIKMLKLGNGEVNAGSNRFPFFRSIDLF